MRRRGSAWLAALVVAVVAVATGCGGSSTKSGSATRPQTAARLEIVGPTPNQTTGTDVQLQLNLTGAQVVQTTTGPLRPDEGHIHVSLDGRLVAMNYGTTQDLNGLTPGPHTVQAEFVATDHAPFANRVVAAVVFTVDPNTPSSPVSTP